MTESMVSLVFLLTSGEVSALDSISRLVRAVSGFTFREVNDPVRVREVAEVKRSRPFVLPTLKTYMLFTLAISPALSPLLPSLSWLEAQDRTALSGKFVVLIATSPSATAHVKTSSSMISKPISFFIFFPPVFSSRY